MEDYLKELDKLKFTLPCNEGLVVNYYEVYDLIEKILNSQLTQVLDSLNVAMTEYTRGVEDLKLIEDDLKTQFKPNTE